MICWDVFRSDNPSRRLPPRQTWMVWVAFYSWVGGKASQSFFPSFRRNFPAPKLQGNAAFLVSTLSPNKKWFSGRNGVVCWKGRNPAPVEVGSISHYDGFDDHPRWLFGISEPSSVTLLLEIHPFFTEPWLRVEGLVYQAPACHRPFEVKSPGLQSGWEW